MGQKEIGGRGVEGRCSRVGGGVLGMGHPLSASGSLCVIPSFQAILSYPSVFTCTLSASSYQQHLHNLRQPAIHPSSSRFSSAPFCLSLRSKSPSPALPMGGVITTKPRLFEPKPKVTSAEPPLDCPLFVRSPPWSSLLRSSEQCHQAAGAVKRD